MRDGRLVRSVVLGLAMTTVGCAQRAPAVQHDGSTTPMAGAGFVLSTLSGKTVALSQHSNSVVLLVFWSHACDSCVKELRAVQRLWDSYKGDGFVLLGVNVDGPDEQQDVRRAVRKHGFGFDVLLDPESEAVSSYNPNVLLPFSVLLAPGGRAVATHAGYRPGDEIALERELVDLLAN